MIQTGIDWMVVPFRKSSFSGTNGGDCVEVGWAEVPFRKSSFSGTNGGECVEVAVTAGVIGVRDSKNPGAGVVVLPASSWASFTGRVKAE